MRRAFAKYLCEVADQDSSIFLLVGDIGFGVFDEFRFSHPNQYLNVGIAEQNAIGLVSGLSKEGFFPVFFTIIPFLIYRPFEFIRNDLLINQRNALLVGVGTGLSYGPLGPTHHAVEDLAVVRALPTLNVCSPSTLNTLQANMAKILYKKKGVTYLRLGKNEEKKFEFTHSQEGDAIQVTSNFKSQIQSKILIISYGDTISGVLDAIPDYVENGIVSIISIERLQPFPEKEIIKYLVRANKILIIDEQLTGSGIINSMYAVASKYEIDKKIISLNLGNDYIQTVGSSKDLLNSKNLSGNGLRKIVESYF